MDYDWVSETILKQEHGFAVEAIIAQGKDDIIDALRAGTMTVLTATLPCGHHAACADDSDGARCLMCEALKLADLWEGRCDIATVQKWELRKALRAIAEHGDGLARVVAELALKELDRA